MSTKALECIIDLTIVAVSCPGVWLQDRDCVYISICLLDQHRRTKAVPPVFPLLFHEKFRFEKIFSRCSDPVQLLELLEEDLVLFELIQKADNPEGGLLLACYEDCVREFLFPYPSRLPVYSGMDREVLMDRTVLFPGISPKLEFCTRTCLKQSKFYAEEDRGKKLKDYCLETEKKFSRVTSPRRNKVYCTKHKKITYYGSSCLDDDQEQKSWCQKSPLNCNKVVRQSTLDDCLQSSGLNKSEKELYRRSKSSSICYSGKHSLSSDTRTIPKEYCSSTVNDQCDKNCVVCRLYKQYLGSRYRGQPLHCLKHSEKKWNKSKELKRQILDICDQDNERQSYRKRAYKSHSSLCKNVQEILDYCSDKNKKEEIGLSYLLNKGLKRNKSGDCEDDLLSFRKRLEKRKMSALLGDKSVNTECNEQFNNEEKKRRALTKADKEFLKTRGIKNTLYYTKPANSLDSDNSDSSDTDC